MIYVASPYSHSDPKVREARYEAVLKYCAEVFKSGGLVFSPIVHWHDAALKYDMPKNAGHYAVWNYNILKRCDELRVLCLQDWTLSVGVAHEIAVAKALKIPVVFRERT